jgi:hypothetical protein
MEAYKNAVIKAKEQYQPKETPFKPGTCHVNIRQNQTLFAGSASTYGWEGYLYDDNGAQIKGCDAKYTVLKTTEDLTIHCDLLKKSMIVHAAPKDVLEFAYDNQKWKSDDKKSCDDLGWEATSPPVSVTLFRGRN